MAAAYATLLSALNIINNLHKHPNPPISLHIKQVESLTQKINFLLEFLQGYNPHRDYCKEADPLECRIADAAYAVEHAIESHILDQYTNNAENIVHLSKRKKRKKNMSYDGLCEALEKVIEDMASIEEEAKQIQGRLGVQHQLPFDSSRSSSIPQQSSMVGADDVKLQMMDKLISDDDLQIIPIVGMGGSDAAYAAEYAIESHILDQFTNNGQNIVHLSKRKIKNIIKKYMIYDGLYKALEKVIEDMAFIEKEAKQIQRRVGVQHQLHTNSTPSDSSRSSSIPQQSIMVGAGDVKLQMMDMLTSDRLHLQIIPIVGMGGSGKTTLARTFYEERLIKEHFDICAWATISQENVIREIIAVVLCQFNIGVDGYSNEHELGEKLYKHLYGRRYLIIMDDMWSIHPWDRVRNYFPNNENGSRIVVTIRLSDLASTLPNSNSLGMELLDEAHSWELLSKTVFGEEGCLFELEEIGKKIVKSCRGLPLSIVVVGGLLAKSNLLLISS